MAAPARSATARSVLSRYRPRWQPERAETHVILLVSLLSLSSSSTRRHWPSALVQPHAAADATAAACARASARSHVATHHRCRHNIAHAHAPAIASSTQDRGFSRSLHRTGVAKITAHAQRRCCHSTPQPCGTHATFFLVWAFVLCPSLAGIFLLLFCGTPCHASSRARSERLVLPHQRARARRARTDDA